MSRDEARRRRLAMQDDILLAALTHVPFDGWTLKSLNAGARDAGYAEIDARRVFDGGTRDMALHAADLFDRRMMATLACQDMDAMRVRDRVTAGVRARIEAMAPYREAIKRLASFMALPGNTVMAGRLVWRTCSLIWYAAGDRSADFNHYSKRGLLLAVYSSTLLCWLADESTGFESTWAFLDRRIADVMTIPKAQAELMAKARAAFDRLPNPFRALRPRAQ